VQRAATWSGRARPRQPQAGRHQPFRRESPRGYTHYFGPERNCVDADNHFTYEQAMKDRSFVAFSARRTF
jgi:hypothetical protein